MKLYSTNNKSNIVNLREATLNSLPIDKGLYMPLDIPSLDLDFIQNLKRYSFPELAFRVSKELIDIKEVEHNELERICHSAINFPAPLVNLSSNKYILELFHGPSLAFKDFGARFMAQLMSYFIGEENKKLTILVATSGDTGGAVAAGFHNIPNIEVIILYPSGKVSPLQEKQLTTWGDNIYAVEWEGTFDDCQSVVKKAFHDARLNKYNLSSANSINIARLIPQTFYYFEAIKQIGLERPVSIAVPSGNIGNISAASLARNMGLPIDQLIAAHNANDTMKLYSDSGEFKAKSSVPTLSNAMDVGNPSNFPRLKVLNGSTWNNVKSNILTYSYSDEQTLESLIEINKVFGYKSEPHAAIAYRALQEKEINNDNNHIFLGTAHPAKFLEIVEGALDTKIEIPQSLLETSKKIKSATLLENDYEAFVDYMLKR